MIIATLLVIALASALLLDRAKCKKVIVFVFLLLFLSSWPPTVWLASQSLEQNAKPKIPPTEKPGDTIVVLGGYLQVNDWDSKPSVGRSTYNRLLYAVDLHKYWPEIPILVTGGQTRGKEYSSLAEKMASFLVTSGIPSQLISIEPNSLNTHENAKFSTALLPPKSAVILVTNTIHMPRAKLAFENYDLTVIAAPCCLLTDLSATDLQFYIPNHHSLVDMEKVLHEWFGLAFYYWKGWV